ncbi:Exosome complex component rrp45 [Neolecta irregularis DAH-3]|uniref:Exosome complex component RRP45 n=1 Tax=Neolecta irregularis (strain DAH-3) TaxID=1198029 RepID=A0A1U7LMU6_NEOID|nr:Exosome complex component rrp45 [Neolecta irregularis DAH-3]|eukprot:OLL23903.1 Exosome complex component rrp45 [Neolecta irregularis DAH-3]
MKDLDPSVNERDFVLKALEECIRIDSRTVEEFRPIKIVFGEEYGLVDVRVGKTRIIVRISAEVTRPYSDRPFEGIFVINTEVSPMASSVFEAGRQSEEEVIISRLIEKAIRRSRALDTESLCIMAGKKCWCLRADVHYLSHDGGLVDATCIAVIAGLLHFRRPDVTVEGEDVTIHPPSERVPVPLAVMHIPICITFSFFLSGTVSIVDADLREERLREGEMTITLNKHHEICQVSKAGGVAMQPHEIMNCMKLALVRVTEISDLLAKALEEDKTNREKQNTFRETAENERYIQG